jgi:hypothetical protein
MYSISIPSHKQAIRAAMAPSVVAGVAPPLSSQERKEQRRERGENSGLGYIGLPAVFFHLESTIIVDLHQTAANALATKRAIRHDGCPICLWAAVLRLINFCGFLLFIFIYINSIFTNNLTSVLTQRLMGLYGQCTLVT